MKGLGRKIHLFDENIGSIKRKLKIEKDGNDSLSIEHKEEIHILHKSIDLLTSRED